MVLRGQRLSLNRQVSGRWSAGPFPAAGHPLGHTGTPVLLSPEPPEHQGDHTAAFLFLLVLGQVAPGGWRWGGPLHSHCRVCRCGRDCLSFIFVLFVCQFTLLGERMANINVNGCNAFTHTHTKHTKKPDVGIRCFRLLIALTYTKLISFSVNTHPI